MSHTDNIQVQLQLRHFRKGAQSFFLDVETCLPGRGLTAIFGQSGSGKTTLLRSIAGLEERVQGTLLVKGETWQSSHQCLPTHKRPIGYVFQESSLFPHLTAKENLTYACKRSGQPTPTQLYDQVIGIMGIQSLLNRRPHQLSGGERQRTAIARALLIQPQILLLDEPLASLDAARKQEILPYLEEMKTVLDIPMLYVSHSSDEVARLADHMLLMDQGKVVSQGKVGDVLSNVEQSSYFGDETGAVLSGQVVERDQQWHLIRIAFDQGEMWIRDSGEKLQQPVRVRIHARDVSLTRSCHSDSSILNRLSVTLSAIVEDQDPSMSLLKLQFGNDFLVARITRRSVHQMALSVGQTVWAQIKSAAIVR